MRRTAALGVLAVAQLALAPDAGAAVDPRDNDYGQTPAQVAAEIAAQAEADPLVVAALRTYTSAQQKVVAARTAVTKAKKALASAKKAKGAARKTKIAKANKKLRAATASLNGANSAAASALGTLTSARADARENASAGHFVPVDGTYDGGVVWYTVEGETDPIGVRIVVTSGHVSAVSVPVYQAAGATGEFNALALPILIDAALHSHDTAEIAAVSGASLTSDAFQKSLQSALIQAGFPL